MESVGDRVIGLGAGTNEIGCYATGDDHIIELMEHFKFIQGVRIAHAAKADLTALGAVDVPSFYPLFDTMVAAYLLPETWVGEGYGFLNLQYLAATVARVKIDSYSDLLHHYNTIDLSTIPEDVIMRYNISQVRATHLIWQKLAVKISPELPINDVFSLEMKILPILARMEEVGILIDKKRLTALGRRYTMEAQELQQAVYELTKGQIANVNSPKQVRDFLFGREPYQLGMRPHYFTKKRNGTASANERTLKKTLGRHPELAWIRLLLRARQIQKLIGTYCIGISKGLDWEGRSHTHLSQTTTDTGRLASKDPNHQNIPKRRAEGLDIRRCFIAPPGHVLLACDMDQIELRIIAEESGEEKMRKVFLEGGDIHTQTAIEVFGTEKERFKAKVFNYTIAYLAGDQQLADQMGISKARAEMYRHTYFRKYKRLRDWIWELNVEVQEKNDFVVETWLGRQRDLSGIYTAPEKNYLNGTYRRGDDMDWVGEGVRKAVNTKIQGSAAEVIKLNMVKVDDLLRSRSLKTRLLLQIHDELLLEVPENEIEIAKQLVTEGMTMMYKTMPLPCTVKIGLNWADVH